MALWTPCSVFVVLESSIAPPATWEGVGGARGELGTDILFTIRTDVHGSGI